SRAARSVSKRQPGRSQAVGSLERRASLMARQNVPKGLFHRRRRDGTKAPGWWCFYYLPGRAQPIRESCKTIDVEEAKRFLHARLAEHPTARATRLAAAEVTVANALTLY